MNKSGINECIAEWLLAKLSSQERASEIVGDLIEQRSGQATFFFAVLRIVVAMTWLRAVGFAAASGSILMLLKAFLAIAIPHLMATARKRGTIPSDGRLVTIASSVWDKTALISLLLSIGMWTTAMLFMTWLPSARRKSIVAFSLAVLFTGISWSAGVPYATAALLIVLGCAMGGLLLWQDLRKSLVLALSGALVCAATLMTALWSVAALEAVYLSHLGHPDNLGLVRGGLFTAAFLLAPACCAAVITLLHARQVSQQRIA